jgi:hypothetical protein
VFVVAAVVLGGRVLGVQAVEESLRALVGALEPSGVPAAEAVDLWCAFDVVERLAASAKTLLARRVEDARAWQRGGHRSAAEQLASVSGTSISAARNMLETSKQVESLPATADALRSGRLSGAKVEAISSAAAIAPGAELRLLKLAARSSLAEVREESLRVKAGVDRDAAHERIRQGRRLREYTDGEGAWNLHARGTPEAGAVFRAALEPIIDELFNAARVGDARQTREGYAFDALIELAERGSGAGAGEVTGPGTGAVDGKARKRASPRFFGLIRVDFESLCRGAVEDDEVCEIAGLGPVPVSVARELLGESVLKLVITKGVDVMNVTHLGRSATIAQKVALWWQSPGCEVEGCTRTQRLQDDHRIGWAKTRRTRVDELDRLCKHHHDLKTYFGWALVPGEGSRPMVPPDDPRHPDRAPPPRGSPG